MANKFKRCVIVKSLSYLLFMIVGIGVGLSAYEGSFISMLAFLSMFLSGVIYLIVLTDQNIDSK